MILDIRFVTKNQGKFKEASELLSNTKINVLHIVPKDLYEIQSFNVEEIVRDKLLKVFKQIGRPLFVEHTSLYIDSLNGFPGGLTQIFWDSLKANRFSNILGNLETKTLTAKTVIAYCDGKKIKLFEGESKGTIPKEPRGCLDFQWDSVFIPHNMDNETYAEMGMRRKNKISMRKHAFDNFNQYLLKFEGKIYD